MKKNIREMYKDISKYKENIPKAQKEIIKQATEIMYSEVVKEKGYKGTQKLPITQKNKVVSSGIVNSEQKAVYNEFGTGIVGSNNPHTADAIAKRGWVYMANPDRDYELGWRYPKEDGTYGWTSGLTAKKVFYNSSRQLSKILPEITVDILSKENRKVGK